MEIFISLETCGLPWCDCPFNSSAMIIALTCLKDSLQLIVMFGRGGVGRDEVATVDEGSYFPFSILPVNKQQI